MPSSTSMTPEELLTALVNALGTTTKTQDKLVSDEIKRIRAFLAIVKTKPISANTYPEFFSHLGELYAVLQEVIRRRDVQNSSQKIADLSDSKLRTIDVAEQVSHALQLVIKDIYRQFTQARTDHQHELTAYKNGLKEILQALAYQAGKYLHDNPEAALNESKHNSFYTKKTVGKGKLSIEVDTLSEQDVTTYAKDVIFAYLETVLLLENYKDQIRSHFGRRLFGQPTEPSVFDANEKIELKTQLKEQFKLGLEGKNTKIDLTLDPTKINYDPVKEKADTLALAKKAVDEQLIQNGSEWTQTDFAGAIADISQGQIPRVTGVVAQSGADNNEMESSAQVVRQNVGAQLQPATELLLAVSVRLHALIELQGVAQKLIDIDFKPDEESKTLFEEVNSKFNIRLPRSMQALCDLSSISHRDVNDLIGKLENLKGRAEESIEALVALEKDAMPAQQQALEQLELAKIVLQALVKKVEKTIGLLNEDQQWSKGIARNQAKFCSYLKGKSYATESKGPLQQNTAALLTKFRGDSNIEGQTAEGVIIAALAKAILGHGEETKHNAALVEIYKSLANTWQPAQSVQPSAHVDRSAQACDEEQYTLSTLRSASVSTRVGGNASDLLAKRANEQGARAVARVVSAPNSTSHHVTLIEPAQRAQHVSLPWLQLAIDLCIKSKLPESGLLSSFEQAFEYGYLTAENQIRTQQGLEALPTNDIPASLLVDTKRKERQSSTFDINIFSSRQTSQYRALVWNAETQELKLEKLWNAETQELKLEKLQPGRTPFTASDNEFVIIVDQAAMDLLHRKFDPPMTENRFNPKTLKTLRNALVTFTDHHDAQARENKVAPRQLTAMDYVRFFQTIFQQQGEQVSQQYVSAKQAVLEKLESVDSQQQVINFLHANPNVISSLSVLQACNPELQPLVESDHATVGALKEVLQKPSANNGYSLTPFVYVEWFAPSIYELVKEYLHQLDKVLNTPPTEQEDCVVHIEKMMQGLLPKEQEIINALSGKGEEGIKKGEVAPAVIQWLHTLAHEKDVAGRDYYSQAVISVAWHQLAAEIVKRQGKIVEAELKWNKSHYASPSTEALKHADFIGSKQATKNRNHDIERQKLAQIGKGALSDNAGAEVERPAGWLLEMPKRIISDGVDLSNSSASANIAETTSLHGYSEAKKAAKALVPAYLLAQDKTQKPDDKSAAALFNASGGLKLSYAERREGAAATPEAHKLVGFPKSERRDAATIQGELLTRKGELLTMQQQDLKQRAQSQQAKKAESVEVSNIKAQLRTAESELQTAKSQLDQAETEAQNPAIAAKEQALQQAQLALSQAQQAKRDANTDRELAQQELALQRGNLERAREALKNATDALKKFTEEPVVGVPVEAKKKSGFSISSPVKRKGDTELKATVEEVNLRETRTSIRNQFKGQQISIQPAEDGVTWPAEDGVTWIEESYRLSVSAHIEALEAGLRALGNYKANDKLPTEAAKFKCIDLDKVGKSGMSLGRKTKEPRLSAEVEQVLLLLPCYQAFLNGQSTKGEDITEYSSLSDVAESSTGSKTDAEKIDFVKINIAELKTELTQQVTVLYEKRQAALLLQAKIELYERANEIFEDQQAALKMQCEAAQQEVDRLAKLEAPQPTSADDTALQQAVETAQSEVDTIFGDLEALRKQYAQSVSDTLVPHQAAVAQAEATVRQLRSNLAAQQQRDAQTQQSSSLAPQIERLEAEVAALESELKLAQATPITEENGVDSDVSSESSEEDYSSSDEFDKNVDAYFGDIDAANYVYMTREAGRAMVAFDAPWKAAPTTVNQYSLRCDENVLRSARQAFFATHRTDPLTGELNKALTDHKKQQEALFQQPQVSGPALGSSK